MNAENISQVLMCRVLGALCQAAGKAGEVGARFTWELQGELQGRFLMSLEAGAVGVTTLGKDSALPKADGHLVWTLGWDDAMAFAGGDLGLGRALDEGRLEVRADRAGTVKLARATKAWSTVDLCAAFRDPAAVVRESALNEMAQASRRDQSAPHRSIARTFAAHGA